MPGVEVPAASLHLLGESGGEPFQQRRRDLYGGLALPGHPGALVVPALGELRVVLSRRRDQSHRVHESQGEARNGQHEGDHEPHLVAPWSGL